MSSNGGCGRMDGGVGTRAGTGVESSGIDYSISGRGAGVLN